MKISAPMLKEINNHIDRKSNRLLRKGFFLGVFVMVGFTLINTYAFTVETNFTNAVQYIKSIFVTSNGKKTGNLLVAMNTGGKALIVNGSTQLLGDLSISGTLDADLNELDPIWTAASSGYYTKTESDSKFLTGETDSKWMSVSGSYYTKTQIDAKGYITGESDPQVGTITTAGNRCKTDGSKINCTESTPTFSEVDPQVGATDNGLRCRGDGSAVQCDQTAPSTTIAGSIRIHDEDLYFRIGTDINHGIGYYGSDIGKLFAGVDVNGPVIYGYNGGALGWHNTSSDSGVALKWDANGKVGIGTETPNEILTVSGTIRIENSDISDEYIKFYNNGSNNNRSITNIHDSDGIYFGRRDGSSYIPKVYILTGESSLIVKGNSDFQGKITIDGATSNRFLRNNAGYLGFHSPGNEMTFGGTSTEMHINYRDAGVGGTPTKWIRHEGSSSTYADHEIGALTTHGSITANSSITATSYIKLGSDGGACAGSSCSTQPTAAGRLRYSAPRIQGCTCSVYDDGWGSSYEARERKDL